MKQNKLTYTQRIWIEDAYKSIRESPEVYDFNSLDGHADEVIEVIKEDVEQTFNCKIDNRLIKQVISENER